MHYLYWMTHYLYALADPRIADATISFRYAGKSRNKLKYRLMNHIREALAGKHRDYKNNWIRSLIRDGVFPVIVEMARWDENSVCKDFDCVIERYFIQEMRNEGFKLVNSTDGGMGVSGNDRSYQRTLEYRLKKRIESLGRRHSDATKARIRDRNLSKIVSVETGRKISIAKTGLKASDKTRAMMSARRRGEGNSSAVLTQKLVNEIRSSLTGEYGEGSSLARQHGIQKSAMSKMIRNLTWHDPNYTPVVYRKAL